MAFCSPKRFGEKSNDGIQTCLSLEELRLIANDYNQAVHKKHAISLEQTKEALYTDIRKHLSKYCGGDHNHEYCWVDQKFISHNTKAKLSDAFRPKKPLEWYKNKHTWLNTFDILDVMKQYEGYYSDFVFMGVYPIDFQSTYPDEPSRCIGKVFCMFDIYKHVLNMDKKRFAVVLNLDYHNEPGSHWVSLYCNLDSSKENFGVFYYDSVASPPPQEVITFMKQVEQQVQVLLKPKKTFVVDFNKVQKQTENSECGVFSMVFLTQMLKEQYAFSHVCEHMRKDKDMNQIRDVLYRPSKL